MARTTVRRMTAVPSCDAVVSVSLDDLTISSSFRESGLNQEHVERLVRLDGRWPPVLVNRADRLVIDGVHRVAAARRLGHDCIEASFFEGEPDEALIEFVRRNVYHGLPLTLRERKRAASRVLVAHPEWSDRRIAELCAISPKTVGRLRLTLTEVAATKPFPQLDTSTRVGRDNRSRPVNSALVRSRVLEAIQKEPHASLRAVARSVGVSPETVRLVRMNMTRPGPPIGGGPFLEALPSPASPPPEASWKSDRALSACRDGEFLSWFDRTAIDDDQWQWVDAVPLSRVYEVAAEARRRSEAWMCFARALEARSGKRT